MRTEIQETGSATRNQFKAVTFLVLGGLAGLLAVLFLRPQTATKLRNQLREQSREFYNGTTDILADLLALTRYDNRQFPARLRVPTNFETPETGVNRNANGYQPYKPG